MNDPKKIDKTTICFHPEHNVPSMMVYPAGTHTHVCPRCGKKTTFTVNSSIL